MSHASKSGRPYRRLRAAILAANNVCHICGKPIDLALSGRHPDGPTLDHVVPLARGGDPYDPSNLRPAHHKCNSMKGAGELPSVAPPSRQW